MTTSDPRPILLNVQHATEAARQAAMVRAALRDAAPTDRIHGGPITSPGDRLRMRGVPIQAVGVGGTMVGTDPLRELLRRQVD